MTKQELAKRLDRFCDAYWIQLRANSNAEIKKHMLDDMSEADKDFWIVDMVRLLNEILNEADL